MNNCKFNNDLVSIVELKNYLNLLLDNNLIHKDDKIQNVLRVVHPDKRQNNTNITDDEFNCATTIFTGYLDFLNETNIEDKTVAYALNLTLPSNLEENVYNTEDMMTTFMQLTNSSPELVSEEIITRVKILGYTVFGVKFDENKELIESEPTPLPNIIGKEYDEKQMNYNSLNSQLESFQCYTQLLVEFRYLLCYAYLLRIYSKELNDFMNSDEYKNSQIPSGGKKNKTRRKKYNKNKKTFKNLLIKGGTLVENLKKYSTFYSWITSRIGEISKNLNPDHQEKIDELKPNIAFFKEYSEGLDKKRDAFYNSDEYKKLKQQFDEKIKQLENKSKARKGSVFRHIFGEINVDDELKTKILTEIIMDSERSDSERSDLEINLKKLWIELKPSYDEIKNLENEINFGNKEPPKTEKSLLENLSENAKTLYLYVIENPNCYIIDEKFHIKKNDDDDCILSSLSELELDTLNKDIDIVLNNSQQDITNINLKNKTKLEEMKENYKKMENKIIIDSEVANTLTLFYNYIVSQELIGDENINIFLDLCETKVKETYVNKIEILAKTEAVKSARVGVIEQQVQTHLKKETTDDFVSSENYSESIIITPDQYNKEIKRQEKKLITTLTEHSSSFKGTIRNIYETKYNEGKTKIENINIEYSKNGLFGNINTNIKYISTATIGLFLNTYGDNPFTKIAGSISIYGPILNGFVYPLLSTILADPQSLPGILDYYYIYLQMVIVVFVTPHLINGIAPSLDNKVVNTILAIIQFMLTTTFIYMWWNNIQGTAIPYMNYPAPVMQYNIAMLPVNASSYYYDLFIKYIPSKILDYAFLMPSFSLRNLIIRNGRSVIGIEAWSLLGISVKGLYSNFRSLHQEKEQLFRTAQQKLQKCVFTEADLNLLIDNFIEKLKKSSNSEDNAELIGQLQGLRSDLVAKLGLSFQAMSAQALAETAVQGRVSQSETQREVASPLTSVIAFPPSAEEKAIKADNTAKFNQEAKKNNDLLLAQGKSLGL